MPIISVEKITKDYGKNRGVFDLTFSVEEGEVMGFLGPNGAGKTTTIRQLMGFIRPDKGSVQVRGMDCFEQASVIAQDLGYLPGEMAFMEDMSGMAFLKLMAGLRGQNDLSHAKELLDYFQLSPSGKIKKMSKGMKQKLGIVAAFMGNPSTYILDEPTSGLDPLMQDKFVQLILAEKKNGKTILMSSHMFDEIERTCDRAVIIKDGRLVAVEDVGQLRQRQTRSYQITFATNEEAAAFHLAYPQAIVIGPRASLSIPTNQVGTLVGQLAQRSTIDLHSSSNTLEELFMHLYGEEGTV